MGMVAAQFVSQAKEKSTSSWLEIVNRNATKFANAALLGILIVAILGFLIERFAKSLFFPLQIQSFFVGLFFSILLYLRGKNLWGGVGYLSKSFIQNKLEWVGTMGFSVYLLHDPILAIVWKCVVTPMNLPFYWMQTIVELVVGVLASVIVSMVFYKLVELPCHQLSKSIVKKLK